MAAMLLTPPAVEPLTLAEAKAFLRVEHDDEDDLITQLVRAARGHVEAATRRALIRQTWLVSLDEWPRDGRIALPFAPLIEVMAAQVLDGAGSPHTLDLQAFVVVPEASLAFVPGTLGAPGRSYSGIVLDIAFGYGSAASDIPEPLRQAVRLLAGHWYENRAMAGDSVARLPPGLDRLLASFRVLSL
jgi:uncharacterized phiE125 gp8 family phage protein